MSFLKPIQAVKPITPIKPIKPLRTVRVVPPMQPVQPLSQLSQDTSDNPYKINSWTDVLFNQEARRREFGDIGLGTIVQAGVFHIENTYVKPALEGNIGALAIGALKDFGETLDVLANPVKGMVIEADSEALSNILMGVGILAAGVATVASGGTFGMALSAGLIAGGVGQVAGALATDSEAAVQGFLKGAGATDYGRPTYFLNNIIAEITIDPLNVFSAASSFTDAALKQGLYFSRLKPWHNTLLNAVDRLGKLDGIVTEFAINSNPLSLGLKGIRATSSYLTTVGDVMKINAIKEALPKGLEESRTIVSEAVESIVKQGLEIEDAVKYHLPVVVGKSEAVRKWFFEAESFAFELGYSADQAVKYSSDMLFDYFMLPIKEFELKYSATDLPLYGHLLEMLPKAGGSLSNYAKAGRTGGATKALVEYVNTFAGNSLKFGAFKESLREYSTDIVSRVKKTLDGKMSVSDIADRVFYALAKKDKTITALTDLDHPLVRELIDQLQANGLPVYIEDLISAQKRFNIVANVKPMNAEQGVRGYIAMSDSVEDNIKAFVDRDSAPQQILDDATAALHKTRMDDALDQTINALQDGENPMRSILGFFRKNLPSDFDIKTVTREKVFPLLKALQDARGTKWREDLMDRSKFPALYDSLDEFGGLDEKTFTRVFTPEDQKTYGREIHEVYSVLRDVKHLLDDIESPKVAIGSVTEDVLDADAKHLYKNVVAYDHLTNFNTDNVASVLAILENTGDASLINLAKGISEIPLTAPRDMFGVHSEVINALHNAGGAQLKGNHSLNTNLIRNAILDSDVIGFFTGVADGTDPLSPLIEIFKDSALPDEEGFDLISKVFRRLYGDVHSFFNLLAKDAALKNLQKQVNVADPIYTKIVDMKAPSVVTAEDAHVVLVETRDVMEARAVGTPNDVYNIVADGKRKFRVTDVGQYTLVDPITSKRYVGALVDVKNKLINETERVVKEAREAYTAARKAYDDNVKAVNDSIHEVDNYITEAEQELLLERTRVKEAKLARADARIEALETLQKEYTQQLSDLKDNALAEGPSEIAALDEEIGYVRAFIHAQHEELSALENQIKQAEITYEAAIKRIDKDDAALTKYLSEVTERGKHIHSAIDIHTQELVHSVVQRTDKVVAKLQPIVDKTIKKLNTIYASENVDAVVEGALKRVQEIIAEQKIANLPAAVVSEALELLNALENNAALAKAPYNTLFGGDAKEYFATVFGDDAYQGGRDAIPVFQVPYTNKEHKTVYFNMDNFQFTEAIVGSVLPAGRPLGLDIAFMRESAMFKGRWRGKVKTGSKEAAKLKASGKSSQHYAPLREVKADRRYSFDTPGWPSTRAYLIFVDMIAEAYKNTDVVLRTDVNYAREFYVIYNGINNVDGMQGRPHGAMAEKAAFRALAEQYPELQSPTRKFNDYFTKALSYTPALKDATIDVFTEFVANNPIMIQALYTTPAEEILNAVGSSAFHRLYQPVMEMLAILAPKSLSEIVWRNDAMYTYMLYRGMEDASPFESLYLGLYNTHQFKHYEYFGKVNVPKRKGTGGLDAAKALTNINTVYTRINRFAFKSADSYKKRAAMEEYVRETNATPDTKYNVTAGNIQIVRSKLGEEAPTSIGEAIQSKKAYSDQVRDMALRVTRETEPIDIGKAEQHQTSMRALTLVPADQLIGIIPASTAPDLAQALMDAAVKRDLFQEYIEQRTLLDMQDADTLSSIMEQAPVQNYKDKGNNVLDYLPLYTDKLKHYNDLVDYKISYSDDGVKSADGLLTPASRAVTDRENILESVNTLITNATRKAEDALPVVAIPPLTAQSAVEQVKEVREILSNMKQGTKYIPYDQLDEGEVIEPIAGYPLKSNAVPAQRIGEEKAVRAKKGTKDINSLDNVKRVFGKTTQEDGTVVKKLASAKRVPSMFNNLYKLTTPVTYKGMHYDSVESAFQASKLADAKDRLKFTVGNMTGAEAKTRGTTIKPYAGWEEEQLDIMEGLLRQKFADPKLQKQLLATGDVNIHNTGKFIDMYWGVALKHGEVVEGENKLGELLMKLRDEARYSIEDRNFLEGLPNLEQRRKIIQIRLKAHRTAKKDLEFLNAMTAKWPDAFLSKTDRALAEHPYMYEVGTKVESPYLGDGTIIDSAQSTHYARLYAKAMANGEFDGSFDEFRTQTEFLEKEAGKQVIHFDEVTFSEAWFTNEAVMPKDYAEHDPKTPWVRKGRRSLLGTENEVESTHHTITRVQRELGRIDQRIAYNTNEIERLRKDLEKWTPDKLESADLKLADTRDKVNKTITALDRALRLKDFSKYTEAQLKAARNKTYNKLVDLDAQYDARPKRLLMYEDIKKLQDKNVAQEKYRLDYIAELREAEAKLRAIKDAPEPVIGDRIVVPYDKEWGTQDFNGLEVEIVDIKDVPAELQVPSGIKGVYDIKTNPRLGQKKVYTFKVKDYDTALKQVTLSGGKSKKTKVHFKPKVNPRIRRVYEERTLHYQTALLHRSQAGATQFLAQQIHAKAKMKASQDYKHAMDYKYESKEEYLSRVIAELSNNYNNIFVDEAVYKTYKRTLKQMVPDIAEQIDSMNPEEFRAFLLNPKIDRSKLGVEASEEQLKHIQDLQHADATNADEYARTVARHASNQERRVVAKENLDTTVKQTQAEMQAIKGSYDSEIQQLTARQARKAAVQAEVSKLEYSLIGNNLNKLLESAPTSASVKTFAKEVRKIIALRARINIQMGKVVRKAQELKVAEVDEVPTKSAKVAKLQSLVAEFSEIKEALRVSLTKLEAPDSHVMRTIYRQEVYEEIKAGLLKDAPELDTDLLHYVANGKLDPVDFISQTFKVDGVDFGDGSAVLARRALKPDSILDAGLKEYPEYGGSTEDTLFGMRLFNYANNILEDIHLQKPSAVIEASGGVLGLQKSIGDRLMSLPGSRKHVASIQNIASVLTGYIVKQQALEGYGSTVISLPDSDFISELRFVNEKLMPRFLEYMNDPDVIKGVKLAKLEEFIGTYEGNTDRLKKIVQDMFNSLKPVVTVDQHLKGAYIVPTGETKISELIRTSRFVGAKSMLNDPATALTIKLFAERGVHFVNMLAEEAEYIRRQGLVDNELGQASELLENLINQKLDIDGGEYARNLFRFRDYQISQFEQAYLNNEALGNTDAADYITNLMISNKAFYQATWEMRLATVKHASSNLSLHNSVGFDKGVERFVDYLNQMEPKDIVAFVRDHFIDGIAGFPILKGTNILPTQTIVDLMALGARVQEVPTETGMMLYIDAAGVGGDAAPRLYPRKRVKGLHPEILEAGDNMIKHSLGATDTTPLHWTNALPQRYSGDKLVEHYSAMGIVTDPARLEKIRREAQSATQYKYSLILDAVGVKNVLGEHAYNNPTHMMFKSTLTYINHMNEKVRYMNLFYNEEISLNHMFNGDASRAFEYYRDENIRTGGLAVVILDAKGHARRLTIKNVKHMEQAMSVGAVLTSDLFFGKLYKIIEESLDNHELLTFLERNFMPWVKAPGLASVGWVARNILNNMFMTLMKNKSPIEAVGYLHKAMKFTDEIAMFVKDHDLNIMDPTSVDAFMNTATPDEIEFFVLLKQMIFTEATMAPTEGVMEVTGAYTKQQIDLGREVKEGTLSQKINYGNPWMKLLLNANYWSETTSRLAMVMYLQDQGMGMARAVAETNKLFIDYRMKSTTDRVMDVLFPFWVFRSRNILLMAEHMSSNYWLFRNVIKAMHWSWHDYEQRTVNEYNDFIGSQMLAGNMRTGNIITKLNPSLFDALSFLPNTIMNPLKSVNPRIMDLAELLTGDYSQIQLPWQSNVERVAKAVSEGMQGLQQGNMAAATKFVPSVFTTMYTNSWTSYQKQPRVGSLQYASKMAMRYNRSLTSNKFRQQFYNNIWNSRLTPRFANPSFKSVMSNAAYKYKQIKYKVF